MTDQGQGYPPYGEPGGGGQQPRYPTRPLPQPPQYPGQPDYGQQPPQPQQPQYPTQPLPQQPQYPGQPGYGQQPPQPQQPQYPGYGAPPPAYPPHAYGPGGPTGPGGPGDLGAAGGGNRKGIYAAIAVAVAAVAAVAAYFVFSGGAASAASPKDTVKKLLEAGKSNDIAAAKKVLCDGDIAVGNASQIGSSGRIISYKIGKQSNKNGITTIEVTASTTKEPTPSSAEFPVVKEHGKWKVCFTKLPSNVPTGLPSDVRTSTTDSGAPSDTGIPTSLPSSLPSGLSICQSATDALSAAEAYIGAAEVGLTEFAQSCVYQNSVPVSVTTSLNGKLYAPETSSSSASQFVFTSTDGNSTVTIEVTKESDGHFYVTGVQKG
jgi:hypothetical protein